jgi:hypothetical protein
MKMRSIAIIATHIGAALLAPAAADVIGSVVDAPHLAHSQGSRQLQELCVCSPRTFTFQLDFSRSCDVNTIEDNPGVSKTNCVFKGDEVEDLPPVNITSITILELDTSGANLIIRQTDIIGPLIDGGTFTYTSVSNELDPNKPLGDQMSNVPGGIMMTLVGKTAAGGSVPMRLAWAYASNCDAEPIGTGDAIGWITLVEYTSAVPAFCNAVETEPPTARPTIASMSYPASFSLAHAKAAKGKAHKAKAGKGSKNGEPIRTRI